MTLANREQQLQSFHLHPQYTNASTLRDPQKRWQYKTNKDNRLQQAVRPPLLGLDVLPTRILENDEDDEDEDEEVLEGEKTDKDMRARPPVNNSKFSLFQYASTGAIYGQEYEVKVRQEDSALSNRALGVDYPDGTYESHPIALKELSSRLADELMTGNEDEAQKNDVIDKLIDSTEGHVAPWKRDAKELQALVDDELITQNDVRRHVDLDLQQLLERLKIYMSRFQEFDGPEATGLDVEARVNEAMRIITESRHPNTL